MNTVTIDHKNGHSTTYKITDNGTAFHIDTPEQVVRILENALHTPQRLKLYLGDSDTGADWGEEHDTTGTIGRSTGNVKIPILLNNTRSIGGGAILDNCIVKIRDMRTKQILYVHPNYRPLHISIEASDLPEYSNLLRINGEIYSRHNTLLSAQRLAKKLS